MASTFPGSVDVFTTKVDGVTDVLAEHVNHLQDAAVAVETEIGATAKGSKADLSERLDVSMNADGTLDLSATTLPNDSVGSAQIAAGAVGASELASDAVTTVKILDANVTGAKIALLGVGTAQLADGGVNANKLASDAVTTGKIADGNVTAIKLATALRNAHEHFFEVRAKTTQFVRSLAATDALLHTSAITNPDVPRVLTHTLKNISGGTLTNNTAHVAIVGVSATGEAINEEIEIPSQSVGAGVSVTVTGTKAFATVTSVQLSDAQTVDWEFSVGVSDLVGLCRTVASVYKLKLNNDDVSTIPAVSTSNGTIDLATIADWDSFDVWYRSA